LEADYKKELFEHFGIVFNRLYTITNMPITRYAKFLKAFGQYESYQELLIHSFNPATLQGLMCRNTLNVGWDGRLYDCDFNQMLNRELPLTIFNVTEETLENKNIETGIHCFGCTAGTGSTCQGAIA
jgi:radical SAM/Cys-rich protein